MKKRNLKGLQLHKKSISTLNHDHVNGGASNYCTVGCTDGCTPVQTVWNCTRGNCTGDCGGGATYICSLVCTFNEE